MDDYWRRMELIEWSERLRKLRKRTGFNQRDLAAHLGTDVPTLCRWERTIHAPSLKFRKLIVEAEATLPDVWWYTVNQVAEIMHVSNRTVYNLISSGELRSLKVGGSRRIPKSCLDEFTEAHLQVGWP